MEKVHLPEELHHELRGRVMKDLVGRADLLDPALVHHHHPVGQLQGLVLIVRDEDAGQVDLVVQPAEPLPQLLPHPGVERPNGSSNSSTFGSMASARARATRCRWPPESWCG